MLAIVPTATISNLTGSLPCIESLKEPASCSNACSSEPGSEGDSTPSQLGDRDPLGTGPAGNP
jgi:hypothetical protein